MGRKPSESQRVTLKDIAEEMGISLSAVNKALNGKPGVSEQLRKKVARTADRLGYRVNRMAQSLSRSALRIGIIMPNLWPNFYGYMKFGMQLKLEALSDYRIDAEYYYVNTLYSKEEIVRGIHHFLERDVDAVILCPNFVTEYDGALDLLSQRNIPLVLLGSDLPNSERLCCVRHDSFLAGRMAAEFMQYLLPPQTSAAVFIGNKNMNDHKSKVKGFCSIPGMLGNPLTDVFETMDEPDLANFLTGKLLREREDICGIYVATSNALAVCERIRESSPRRAMRVIGTDILDEMQGCFQEKLLQGVIFQDPVSQGKQAIQVLFDYLTMGKPAKSEMLIMPRFVLASDFSHYLSSIHEASDRLQGDAAWHI